MNMTWLYNKQAFSFKLLITKLNIDMTLSVVWLIANYQIYYALQKYQI